MFTSELELCNHNLQEHPYCPDCERPFTSRGNLENHRRSKMHNDKRYPCPMPDCPERFTSRMAVVLHIETGECVSRVTRAGFDAYVIRTDQNRFFVDPDKVLRTSDGSYKRKNPILDADIDGYKVVRTPKGDIWYRCLRVGCGASFEKLEAFRNHARSKVHDDDVYVCARKFGGCGSSFSSFGSLAQHVHNYNESCNVEMDHPKFLKFTKAVLNKLRHSSPSTYLLV